jgi:hypothetical protein
MFRLYLSHLQALKGQIHSVSRAVHCGIPNAYNKMVVYNNFIISIGDPTMIVYNNFIISVGDPTVHCSTYCMDLTLEGLKMTQVESKHVALCM